jgi:hypothetical protein
MNECPDFRVLTLLANPNDIARLQLQLQFLAKIAFGPWTVGG